MGATWKGFRRAFAEKLGFGPKTKWSPEYAERNRMYDLTTKNSQLLATGIGDYVNFKFGDPTATEAKKRLDTFL